MRALCNGDRREREVGESTKKLGEARGTCKSALSIYPPGGRRKIRTAISLILALRAGRYGSTNGEGGINEPVSHLFLALAIRPHFGRDERRVVEGRARVVAGEPVNQGSRSGPNARNAADNKPEHRLRQSIDGRCDEPI